MIEADEGGVTLRIRVQPGANRTEIVGIHDQRIKLAVTAAPENGKANAAVLKLIASELGISRSQVQLIRGSNSRNKDLRLLGVTVDQVATCLLPDRPE